MAVIVCRVAAFKSNVKTKQMHEKAAEEMGAVEVMVREKFVFNCCHILGMRVFLVVHLVTIHKNNRTQARLIDLLFYRGTLETIGHEKTSFSIK